LKIKKSRKTLHVDNVKFQQHVKSQLKKIKSDI
jgi:hypothetical protein